MGDETTLLPCPFCGGEVELKEYKPNVSGVSICKECGARSPICKNDHTGGWKSKAIAVWNTRAELGNGTLTAEQVREAVMSADRWEKPMGNTELTNTHLIIRDDGWQAIADELNRQIGGTCKWTLVEEWTDTDAGRECDYEHWTLDCGCWDVYDERFLDFDDYESRPKGIGFCERCGKAVKR